MGVNVPLAFMGANSAESIVGHGMALSLVLVRCSSARIVARRGTFGAVGSVHPTRNVDLEPLGNGDCVSEILVGVDLILVVVDHLPSLAQFFHFGQLIVNFLREPLNGDFDTLPFFQYLFGERQRYSLHRGEAREEGLEILHAQLPKHWTEIRISVHLIGSEETRVVEPVVERLMSDIGSLDSFEHGRRLAVGERHQESNVIPDVVAENG